MYLRKNKSKIIYPSSWRLIKIGNSFYYKDKNSRIKLNTKYVHSKGMRENVCLAIKVALDLKINKKIIQKTLPKLFFEGRFQYLREGKIKESFTKIIYYDRWGSLTLGCKKYSEISQIY